jgi:hypothetical protein
LEVFVNPLISIETWSPELSDELNVIVASDGLPFVLVTLTGVVLTVLLYTVDVPFTVTTAESSVVDVVVDVDGKPSKVITLPDTPEGTVNPKV